MLGREQGPLRPKVVTLPFGLTGGWIDSGHRVMAVGAVEDRGT